MPTTIPLIHGRPKYATASTPSAPGRLTAAHDWDETIERIREYNENPNKDSDLREEKLKYFFDKSVNGPDNSERIVEEIKKRLGM